MHWLLLLLRSATLRRECIKWTLTRDLLLLLLSHHLLLHLLLLHRIHSHLHAVELLLLWHTSLEVLLLGLLMTELLIVHHLLLRSRHNSRLEHRIWHEGRLLLFLLLLSIYRLSREWIISKRLLIALRHTHIHGQLLSRLLLRG